jgi:hypothetical protein
VSGCFFVGGILLLSFVSFWFGEVLQGWGLILGAYFGLIVYNRLTGSGAPTFTFKECKDEWEDQIRGK